MRIFPEPICTFFHRGVHFSATPEIHRAVAFRRGMMQHTGINIIIDTDVQYPLLGTAVAENDCVGVDYFFGVDYFMVSGLILILLVD